jgi:hypothetical protein
MTIVEVRPEPNGILSVVADDGRAGVFDVSPYLGDEAFEDLRDPTEFMKVSNGGYFVEWDCGADLSAATIEAHGRLIGPQSSGSTSHGDESDCCEVDDRMGR